MGKIVITGASGNYGRGVTDALIAQGRAADLILITRKPEKLAERAAQGCDVRYGDFDKPDTLAAAVQGADKMLLISGTRVGARVVQHKAAIDAAASAGVQHIAAQLHDVAVRVDIDLALCHAQALPGQAVDPLAKEYLRLVLSREGQAILAAQAGGYLPLTAAQARTELEKLE